jgi:hypothetical protein
MNIGLRRVLIVSPLLLLSILLMLLFLVNSIAGLPPTITSPFCPNEITESGYVDMVEFVQSDCVGAVKGATEQTVPYFQGMDLAAIVFFLVLSLFFVRMLTNSSYSEYKESPRMAAMLDASIWDDETVFEPTPMQNSYPQQNHEEQQNQGGFHNPFDF